MFNKIKSISKRTLALILTLLMLLSSGIVGTLAANVELAETGASITFTADDILFFNMKAVSWWTAGTNGNGNFAYFFNDSTGKNAWSAHAVQYSGDIYYVKIPAGTWEKVILTRNNTSTAPSWDNKWNQTGNIDLSSTSNYISKFSEGSTSVTWSTQKPASNVSLSASSTSVNTNTAVTLTPSLTSNTTYNEIKSTTYTISPSSGASISGNTFTAATAGTYTVTASITYNARGYSNLTTAKTATTTITVTQPGFSFTTEANPKEGGSVTPASGKGTSVEIKATPATGYEFVDWTVTGTGSVSNASSATTTFNITDDGAKATANFKLKEYDVTFKDHDGIILKGPDKVTHGSDAVPPADPDNKPNYHFSGWDKEYTNITADTVITAKYTINSYPITVEVNNSNYGSAYANPTSVEHDKSTVLSATAKSGYRFDHWEDENGNTISSENPYTVTNITGERTFTAVFEELHRYKVQIINDDYYGTGDSVKINGETKTVTNGNCTVEDLYGESTVAIELNSKTHYYISSLKINGVEYAEDPAYFPNYLYVFEYDKKITSDLIIEVEHTHNPYLYKGATQNGTLTLGLTDNTSHTYKTTGITFNAVAETDYYVSKVYTKDNAGNILKTYYSGTDSEKTSFSGTLDALEVDTTVYAEFEAIKYNYITVEAKGREDNTNFNFAFVANNKTLRAEADGTFRVEVGSPASIAPSEDGDSPYYISAIKYEGVDIVTNTDQTKISLTGNFTVKDAQSSKITIEYGKRPVKTVKVVNDDSAMGKLNPEGNITKYLGETVVITPTAYDRYEFAGWTVEGATEGTDYTVSGDGKLTLTVVGDITVTAKWDTKKTVKVTLKAPASQGWASVTGVDKISGAAVSFDTTGTKNWAEVSVGTVLTFTSTPNDTYLSRGWDIDGNHTVTSNTNNKLVITANGDVTVTAVYAVGNRTVYATDVPSGWNKPIYAYYSDGGSNKYFKMTQDGTTWYLEDVPTTISWIKFIDREGDSNNYWQYNGDGTIFDKGDTFNLKNQTVTGSTSSILTYSINYDSKDYAIENYGDGNHIGTIEIPAGKTSISVYPHGTNGKYWNFTSQGSTAESANVTESSSKGTPTNIDLGANTDGVLIDFSFNPTNGTLSWTVTQMKATVNVKVNYGMEQNQADPTPSTDNHHNKIGNVYFDTSDPNIYSFTKGDGNTAKVVAGELVTIYSDINLSAYLDGVPVYRIEGWVIETEKSVDFVNASSSDGKTFYGIYSFTENATVIPVYFHTDKWLADNKVETVTVYAALDTLNDTTPTTQIEGWQKAITSYTWYYDENNKNQYMQFGYWTGQYMIPLENGIFKTYVETNSPKSDAHKDKDYYDMTISGITFADKYGRGLGDGSWYQTYDYYEFKSLIDNNRFNITFVLRYHNNSSNNDKNPSSSISINSYNWMDYINYTGEPMDIYRNVIKEKTETQPDNTLYIVRTGPEDYLDSNNKDRNDGQATGDYFVEVRVYTATGVLIDSCLSYELVDPNSKLMEKIRAKEAEIQATNPGFTYEGGTVKVSYETYNSPRYDGEWYGDLTDTTKVNINVLVGFTTDDGKNINVLDVSANEYGTATVNGQASAEVTRGAYATLLASEKPGYKFIGWYNTKKDGDNIVASTLLTTDYTKDIEASFGGTYVAVYRERTGGEFDVLNLKYAGDVSDPSVPFAHGGESYRYVSVVHTHTNGSTTTTKYDKQANGISLKNVKEDDILEITIYTDAFYPEDYFYAWYMEVRDDNGKIVNFEEVGVDKSHVGSKDEVSFTFTYKVKKNDNGITVYSDVFHKEITKDIIYLYQDRYNQTKQYVKTKYTLEGEELLKGVPSEETIIKYAPWVEDLYKDTNWIFDEDKFTEDSWTLVATQAPTMYDVTVWVEDESTTYTEAYDGLVEVLATRIDPAATNNGYWFEDLDFDGTLGENEVILAYGAYYGLRVKRDITCLRYIYGESINLTYDVVLDELVYGREQYGENGAVDKIFIDFMTSVHIPYFRGQKLPNGQVITDVYYDGQVITSANSPVTFETLEKFGCDVSYGLILEQVGTFKIGENEAYKDYVSAETEAISEGFKKATEKNNLNAILASGKTLGMGETLGATSHKGAKDEHYTIYDLSSDEYFVSNKNRYTYTIKVDNTVGERGRFFNVYAYVAVTYTPEGSDTPKTDYYYSALQPLNTYETGTNDSSDY